MNLTSTVLLTLFVTLLLSSVSPALAGAPSRAISENDKGDITITMYQGGFSLIRDIRTMDLSRGINHVQLQGLPESLNYASLLVRFDGESFNPVFDTRSPDFETLIRGLVGTEIRLDHIQGGSIHGVLVQYSPSLIIIKQADGNSVVLPGLAGYRISSANLSDFSPPKPGGRLSLSLDARRAGTQNISLYYLVPGLRWNAEYALILDTNEQTGQLSGWTIIQNNSGADFSNATIQLIAGELQIGGRGPVGLQHREARMRAMEAAAADLVYDAPDAASFSEYIRFDMPGRHNIPKAESRRLLLLNEIQVTTNKRYRYTSMDRRMEYPESGHVRVQYDISRRTGLQRSLPYGTLKIYAKHNDQLQLVGEDHIGNIPVSGRLIVTSGRSFDILVQENTREFNRITDRISEQKNEVVIVNNRSEDIVVEVERELSLNQRITGSNIPGEQVSAQRTVFRVPVKKGESATLTFTIRSER